ncbi:acyltransferase [Kocuria flava]|uniref:acyltransferase family protein n=1 Tax=Kocuria flava TaxID=446860 RepID=UPI001FF6CB85|nr:acyltransferase [Kocuria flava]MCJ8504937.1 acyltransferase [Kocuria flava]
MATTLHDRLDGRTNRLNAIRLALASLVVLGHAWPLTGAEGPSLEVVSDVAVNGFFVLSGFLIARSRVRTGLVPFLWRRFLRIYPGFLVSLLVVAVVLAPVAAALEGTALVPASAAGFVLANADLRISQWGIDGTLVGVPAPDSWNGSLWTLFHEALAYLLIGLVLSLAVAVRRARWVLPGMFLAVVVLRVLAEGPLEVSSGLWLSAARLTGCFLAGAAVWAFADTWRPTPSHVVAAASVYALLTDLGWADLYGQLPLAVLLLGLGAAPARDWTTRTDLSYGVYIYAYPVQQLLVLLGTASWGVAANTVLVLALTLPLALLSWRLVERPALRAKAWLDPRDRSGRRPPGAVPAGAAPGGRSAAGGVTGRAGRPCPDPGAVPSVNARRAGAAAPAPDAPRRPPWTPR